MKLIACATALIVATAAPALAQKAPAAPAPSTAAPVSTTAPAATTAATATTGAKFSLDTPIETLVADAAAKAVLDADVPGMTAHPAFDQFKSMSLKQLQPISQGQITDETLAKVATDLAAIK